MRPSKDDLVAAYKRDGWEAALQLDLAGGAPNRRAARARLQHYGIRKGTHRQWRTEEVRMLLTLWGENVPAPQIALRIGRSEQAVYIAIQRFGAPQRRRPPWTRAQRKLVDASVDQLIAHLQMRFSRSEGGIINEMTRALRERGKRRKAQSLEAA